MNGKSTDLVHLLPNAWHDFFGSLYSLSGDDGGQHDVVFGTELGPAARTKRSRKEKYCDLILELVTHTNIEQQ